MSRAPSSAFFVQPIRLAGCFTRLHLPEFVSRFCLLWFFISFTLADTLEPLPAAFVVDTRFHSPRRASCLAAQYVGHLVSPLQNSIRWFNVCTAPGSPSPGSSGCRSKCTHDLVLHPKDAIHLDDGEDDGGYRRVFQLTPVERQVSRHQRTCESP